MRFSAFLPAVAGLSTIVAVSVIAPSIAHSATFQAESGVTSVFLDFDALETLGITLAGADGVVDPASSDFQVGFAITPETDFTFSDDNGFTPISGTIEHSGSISLAIDTLGGDVALGDFTIGFDANRVSDTTSGFFVQDNLDLDTVLFDIDMPDTLALDDDSLTLVADLLVAPEFAEILTTLEKPDLTGVEIGAARTDANLVAVSDGGASVPEPATVLGLVGVGAAVLSQKAGRRA
ncbi:MAG: PEP-CTERM sorting domain-containing protein [Cyanobacteria bacterium P01_C01_bin.73]